MTRHYDKLVRDEIPAVIRGDGERPVTHVAEGEEYERRLREKLVEEATEFEADGSLDELGDVLGVVLAVCEHRGVSLAELREREREKAEERGGFAKGVVLERVEESADGSSGGE